MGDLVVLVLVVVLFAALVGLVHLCDRIVGPGEEGTAKPERAEPERAELERVEVGRDVR